jgi:hypothetical protein
MASISGTAPIEAEAGAASSSNRAASGIPPSLLPPPAVRGTSAGGSTADEWVKPYCNWIENWCDEVIYMLHIARYDTEEAIQKQQLALSANRELQQSSGKTRVGLRAKIAWVQSPEDL